MSTRRYHFIVPKDPKAAPLLPGTAEAQLADACVDDCGSDTPYMAPVSVFDSHGHLLHGVLHMNGFGHLLRINGLEGGSANMAGVTHSAWLSELISA